MSKKACLLGKKSLPLYPCFFEECQWYVNNSMFCNCFLLVNDFMANFAGFDGFTLDEISKMEKLPKEDVEKIIEESMKKIRTNNKKALVELYDLNYED